jgi:PAS domain S-box-containing protein
VTSAPRPLDGPPAPEAAPELLGRGTDTDLFRLRGGPQPRLLRVLAAERAGAALLERELALRDALDAEWAVLPLELTRHGGRPALLLADPGGRLLEDLVASPLEPGRFLPVAAAFAGALRRLHERGIIHKDVRPANALYDPHTAAVRLTGFGVATRQPREREPLSPLELVAGTLAYMAPEQTGRMNRGIDSRSDLYALGASLYQLLTGALPFNAADPMALFHCHMAREPVPPAELVPGLPATLSAIVMKLLAKSQDDRYQTAAGLESDLRRCLAQWQARGRVDDFRLDARGGPARLPMPGRLHGRQGEIARLQAAFDRVAGAGGRELVLVSGPSGTGKSSIAGALQEAVLARGGLFAAGKFDEARRDIPYATLAEAFRGVVRQILGHGEERVREWRERLLAALGPNASLVVRVLPELERVIGLQPPTQELPPGEAQSRLQAVFHRFVGVLARPQHPLVLFLDDLQWLDAATLQLLEGLLAEDGLRHLLLVGAFRAGEVDAVHPLTPALAAFRRAPTMPVHDVVLEPLAPADLRALVGDALRCAPDDVRELAQLVHEKTGGNPFFAAQFLGELAEDGLLSSGGDGAGWAWDLGGIRARGLTDNVVDLLVGKLARLPVATQGLLELLGCLGDGVPTERLAELQGAPEPAIHEALREAVRAGLVVRSESGYAFLHDRIRQAACSRIPPDTRAAIHLRIARLLAARTPPARIDEAVFEIVNHFDAAAGLLAADDERVRVAGFHLAAGRRAKESMACAEALRYLSTGCALLPADAWSRHPGLAFALEFHRADCEYLTGDLAAAEERLARLAARATGAEDLSLVTCARINLLTTQGRADAAVEAGLDTLRRLGIPWSAHPPADDVGREFDCLRRRVGGRAIESLVDLPLATDGSARATLDVLMTLLPPALFTDENLLGLVVGRMANISLESGPADASCIGFAWLGMFLGPRFGDYQEGYRFGRLGIDLVDRRGLDRHKARVYVHFGNVVLPWTHPLHAGLPWVRRAFETARDNGDVTFAAYSRNHLITNLLASGAPLQDIQREAEAGLDFVRKARFGLVADIIATQLQLVRALRGETTETARLDDAGFAEDAFERHLEEDPRLAIAACWYWIRKLQARMFAGEHAAALEAAGRAQALLWTSPSHVEVAEFHFHAALAQAALCPDGAAAAPPALAAHAALLAEWARNCPANFAHRAALVDAEIARIEARPLDAMRAYERAARTALENGFVQDEALANERAAAFYRAQGFPGFAENALRQARDGYARWGADGKVRQLEARHAGLQPAPARSPAAPLAQLDVLTVAKASQAISGQIMLDELIDTLMHIALENAGAQRGCLLLLRGDELRLAAEAEVDGVRTIRVVLHAGKGLPQSQVPAALIDAVRRGQAPVLLADAALANPYSGDPCWAGRAVKSVLCLPILRRSTLLGVLYLENNLVSQAFVPQRVAVLELLAAQAAISIENALLYADLQRENLARRQAESTLREREGRIRRLVEANIIGVFFWNVRGEVTDANDAFLEMLGYDRKALHAGEIDWVNLTPAEYRPLDAQAMSALHERGGCAPYEKEYVRRNGHRIPVLIGAAFLEGTQEDGVAYVLDLTERRQADADRQARREAELANRAKSSFLANMSHELRTPLNAVLGYAQILRREPGLSELQANGLDTIRRGGEHVLALINDVLDLARIEAGKVELLVQPLDLPRLLHMVHGLIQVEAQRKGLEFVRDVAPDLPAAVSADGKRLEQVLLNLLGNAVKFTERGRVTLRVRRLPALAADAARLRFEVHDTGIGIATEQLQSLFRPFEQAADVQRRYGGSGLGLAISQQLVGLMGGRIAVEGGPAGGSVFSFELELALALPGTLDAGRPVAPVGRSGGYRGPRRKLLVVDDVAANRSTLVDFFASLGFELHQADDGESGLERAHALRPDLILMDVVMPGVDGLEATRRLRREPALRDIPIIALSASATAADEQLCLQCGADAFVAKPVDLEALLSHIDRLLRLEWIAEPAEAAAGEGAPADALVPPPPEELALLHALARIGNMRSIGERAEFLAAANPAYGPFATRLRELARRFQSRAILEWMTALRGGDGGMA